MLHSSSSISCCCCCRADSLHWFNMRSFGRLRKRFQALNKLLVAQMKRNNRGESVLKRRRMRATHTHTLNDNNSWRQSRRQRQWTRSICPVGFKASPENENQIIYQLGHMIFGGNQKKRGVGICSK